MTMQKFQRATIFLLLFLSVPSIWAAETPSENADALLNGLIKTNDPGLAILVAQDGKIIFEKSYGLADLEHHVPVIPQTTFRIASMTKQFTASAILKLQEQGKLSIDDKLAKYIPDFPRGNEVTLRQLLTHTSGIHDYSPELDHLSDVVKPITTEANIGVIKNQKHLYDFDPGTKWRYDNSGYELLGYIVEKVSGQSYGDFLRENFFQPLGMTNTGVYREHLGLPHEALGYSLGTNGFEPPFYIDPSWSGGDGALYSTVEDLYHWNEGIFNGRALDAASLKAAFTPVGMKEGQLNSGDGYGFGWYVGHYRGLLRISHGGARPDFTSMMLRLPDENFTVVVLANSDGRLNVGSNSLAYQLVDTYLADKLAPRPSSKRTLRQILRRPDGTVND
jgi:CubicO group peptidase (beta-lactamase class C family)